MIGFLLSSAVALSFLGLGAGAAYAPEALAENYGLPVKTETGVAYVRALGVRDAVIGTLVLWFVATRDRPALAATIGISALVGAGDFAIVLAARGTAARTNLVIHGGGTLGILAVWGLLRAGR